MDFYDNRELSWLKFNKRVLEEACDKNTPLFEKLRFLAISTSNLDEFYMVRVGSIMDRILVGDKTPDDKTGLSYEKQLEKIYKKTNEFYSEKEKTYDFVVEELYKKSIKIHKVTSLFGGKAEMMRKIYERRIRPLLSVQVVDSKNPFPHLENKAVCCAFLLLKKDKYCLGLVLKSPSLEETFLINRNDSYDFILTDDVINEYAGEFFKGYKIIDKCKLRVTRNADIEILENELFDEFDYRSSMKKIIKKRQRLSPVRYEVSKRISKEFKKLILNKKETLDMIFVNKIPLSFEFVGEMEKILPKEFLSLHTFKPKNAILPVWINSTSVMKKVREGDIFLNYPFDSMRIFLKLLHDAAEDKNVTSIKITLYRVNKNSKIIDALIKAAENGKDVLCIVELRARFDEENNINYSEILEEAGVRVLYGPEKYKVHSKLCLITVRKKDGISYITQCGTGNYNEKTAQLYTDMNIITCDYAIGNDAKNFFDNISSGNVENTYDKLVSSPFNIEKMLISHIDEEIMYHNLYNNGRIIIKINSLTEKTLIDKIIDAARAGVKVDLIVRGVCCLVPSSDEIFQNINIISVVGRFLEHSRVYFFNHNGVRKIYISSADLMTRNLKKRVEIACPVENPKIKEAILQNLELILSDDVKGRKMDKNGDYLKKETIKAINSQEKTFDLSDEKNKSVTHGKRQKDKTKKKLTYFRWLFKGGV